MTDTIDRATHADIQAVLAKTLDPDDDAGEGMAGAVAILAHRYQLAVDALDRIQPGTADHIRTAPLPGPMIHTPYRIGPVPQPATEQRHEPTTPGPIVHVPAPLPCPVCGHDERHHELANLIEAPGMSALTDDEFAAINGAGS